MPRLVPLLVALAVLSPLLAGCAERGVDDDPSTPSDPDAPSGAARTEPPATGVASQSTAVGSPLRLADGEPTTTTTWANGTFQVQQNRYPSGIVGGSLTMGDNPRPTDISDLVPTNVPARIVVEVDADVGDGDVDIWISAPSSMVWTTDWDTPYGGYSLIQFVVVRTSPDPITVWVQYDEVDDKASFDYALRIDVETDPLVLPAGVAVGVDLPGPGTAVHVERTDSTVDTFLLVFDPRDRLLARVQIPDSGETFVLDDAALAGEYVIMLARGGSDARISIGGTHESEFRARALSKAFRVGELRSVDGKDPVTWTFDETRAPIQVFVRIDIDGVDVGYSLSLASPDSTLLDVDRGDEVFAVTSSGSGTAVGAEGLVAGTYTATVSPSAAVLTTATEIVVHYER